MDFSGIFPALTTPFAADGSVSLSDLKHNVQLYNRTDLAGYVALGSTGESVLLSDAEMEGVLVTVKEAATNEKKLIAGDYRQSSNMLGIVTLLIFATSLFLIYYLAGSV